MTCEICDKGFITQLQFENSEENSEKIFCSNALCWFNQTITTPIGSSVIEVTPIMVNN